MRLLFILCLLSSIGYGQIIPATTQADVHEIIENTKDGKVDESLRSRFPINNINGIEYVSFLMKKSPSFNEDILNDNGLLVGAQIGDIVSIKHPLSQLNEVLQSSHFSEIHLARKVQPLLNKVPADVRADSVWAGYGLPQGYTGKNVLIGVTDWGFDYTHPMFYDTLLQTNRILAAWDQFKNSGPAPSGYSYGAEYNTTANLLNAESDTANIYSYGTHGTHVAGIAGGSGAGIQYRGIAFESQFLFTTFLIDEASVLDAWDWMQSKAISEGKRLVINMSWGLYWGSLDGTSLLSQAISTLTDEGIVFVSSAGNNGDVDFHLDHTFSNDTLKSRIAFYNSSSLASLWGQSIQMWGEAGQPFSAGLQVFDASNNIIGESPLYSSASTPNYVDTYFVAGTDTVWYNVSADAAYATNNRPQIRIRVKYLPASVKVVLKVAAATGKVHCWNVTELSTGVGNWGMPFMGINGTSLAAGDNKYGIGEPACAHTCISVAAHNAEYYSPSGTVISGSGASFSSVGPLYNDSLKPDISAPGVGVASSVSSYTDNSFNSIASVTFNGRTYPFAYFSGTSMSGPVVAGVVALILESNPYLSGHQIKDILKQTARTDQHTGAIPPHSTTWGWGKVNAHAAILLALSTTGTEEITTQPDWKLYPNPSQEVLNIENLNGNVQSIQIVDMSGHLLNIAPDQKQISVSELKAGIYLLRVIRDNKVEQQKFIKQ